MLLVIDIGNTNMVFALYKGQSKVCDFRCKTVPGRTADEYAVWLDHLMSHQDLDIKQINNVIISSVVPDINFDIKTLAQKYFKTKALSIGYDDIDTGLDIQIDRPEELGADRIVNSIAAIEKYELPVIIIDFGTATTFDVIDNMAGYRGGAIAPGVNLSMEALQKAAAQLPTVAIKKPDKALATNTVEAIQSGIYWGYVSMIRGMLQHLQEGLGINKLPFVIATGGLAKLFQSDIPEIKAIDDHLTLDGLVMIHQRLHQT